MMNYIIVLASIFTFSSLHSVGLLTQYQKAKEFINRSSYTEKEKNLFFLGVWFPGIWYISSDGGEYPIDFSSDLLAEVKSENHPFLKGIKFNHLIHQEERIVFKNIFENKFDNDLSFLIKECYLNILQDHAIRTEKLISEVKLLLNEVLYTDYDMRTFSSVYKENDIITWYYAILASLQTNPLEIPEDISSSSRYKGLRVTLKVTDDILFQAKKNLPILAEDREINETIRVFLKNN